MPKHLSSITLAAVTLTSGLGISTVIQSATAQNTQGPITDMMNVMNSFGARVTGLETRDEEQNSLLEEVKAENESLRSNVKLLNLQISALQSQIDTVRSDVDTMYDTNIDIQLQHEEARVMLEAELAELGMRLAEFDASGSGQISLEELQSLRDMMDGILTQITILEARITILEDEPFDGSGNSGGNDQDNDNNPIDEDNDSDGFTVSEGDCNDEDAGISPGEDETSNGIDDDCDGQVDEGTIPIIVEITVEPIDDSGSLADTMEYAASATYSDGSVVDVTNGATWKGDGTANAGTEPGAFLCVGSGTGEVKATYQGKIDTAPYTCQLV
jgi:hypothetical protein